MGIINETMERRTLLPRRLSSCDVEHEASMMGLAADYDGALAKTGFGRFQYILLLVCGLANASDAIELLCVSILLPAAQCDLNMSSADKGWLNAMVFVGMMVGGYIWGCLGDIYGRRSTLIVSLMVNAVAGLVSSLAQSFEFFLAMRFISGLGVGGSIPLVWAYVSEFQPPEKRGGALSVIASFWMIGNIIVAGLAIGIIPLDIGISGNGFQYNSWRIFMTVCALPALITAVIMFWMPESPMFLLVTGKQDQALSILRKMYAMNLKANPHSYPITEVNSFGEGVRVMTSKGLHAHVVDSVIHTVKQTRGLFSRPLMRVTLLMLCINFAIQFGYYGLWLWFPELFNRLEMYYNDNPGGKISVCELTNYVANGTMDNICDRPSPIDTDALVNTLIIAAAPLPANVWTIFYMDRLGRKFFLVLSMVLSGLAAFFIYLVQSSMANLVLSCVFGAISTMGFNALDCLGAELFPTHLRSTALAVTLVFARLGAIMGNIVFGYLIDTVCVLPMMLVSLLLIGGGLLGLLLPNSTQTALK